MARKSQIQAAAVILYDYGLFVIRLFWIAAKATSSCLSLREHCEMTSAVLKTRSCNDIWLMNAAFRAYRVGSVDFTELLPGVKSIRELAESFNKKSGTFMADGRRMLGDISASVNKKLGGPRR